MKFPWDLSIIMSYLKYMPWNKSIVCIKIHLETIFVILIYIFIPRENKSMHMFHLFQITLKFFFFFFSVSFFHWSYKSTTETMKKLFHEDHYDKRLRPFHKGNGSLSLGNLQSFLLILWRSVSLNILSKLVLDEHFA